MSESEGTSPSHRQGKRQMAHGRFKRDEMMKIQSDMQARWAESHAYEPDVPSDLSQPKYFVTFPYPYMNGFFHLGHAFTMSKPDFYARYKRMKGFNVLYPFGLHCTGQPIVACANLLDREMTEFGTPPVFPEPDHSPSSSEETEGENIRVHAKQASKGGKSHQWDIMLLSGFSPSEIPPFRDPSHWIRYFPSQAKEQLLNFGLGVDLRRTFITTSANPYYDSFIRWQFNLLKKLDLVRFGKRMSVFSPLDGEQCPDHARSVGEHVRAKEFVIIKLRLCEEDLPETDDWNGIRESGKQTRVFLGAATLRPETMYGQTNCWLLPTGVYGAYEMKNGDVLILTERAARNLAYQDQLTSTDAWKESLVPKFQGKVLFGCRVAAPLCQYEWIHILPMTTIDCKKTTGVVTSVPSDSPDDYAAYTDLRTKPGLREKFDIDESWVRFDVVNIIRTQKYGDCAAKSIVETLNIQSQRQVDLIKQAHDEVYKVGFYKGTMIIGDFEGMSVVEAKDKIRDLMIAEGKAIPYFEPENLVVSRAGDVCVCCPTDQWYLRYGEEDWKMKVLEHAEKPQFVTFSDATRKEIIDGIHWLHEWGCTREFGLGTKLPFDPKYLIESLSDSTIYMAYYTIAHFLQGDIFGAEPGVLGISPEQLSDEVFDFIFRRGDMPECSISEESLLKMRTSFEYWYPVDLRVSGKDLVKNHLLMFLYNHAAIFDQKFMPAGIAINGWIQVDGGKMSKSRGNFIMMKDAVEEYTADGVRIALAAAGDSLADANFETSVANNCLLDIHTTIHWCTQMLKLADEGQMRTESTPEFAFFDSIFEEEMKQCVVRATEGYEKFRFMVAVNHGWYNLASAKDRYEYRMGRATPQNMRADLVRRYVHYATLLIAPIAPHTSEYLWTALLENEDSVLSHPFPVVDEPNWIVLEREKYLLHTLHSLRQKKKRNARRLQKVGGPNHAHIIVAAAYEDWQVTAMSILRDEVAVSGESAVTNMRALSPKIREAFTENRKLVGQAMSFLAARSKRYGPAKHADPSITVENYFSGERSWDELGFWRGENAMKFSATELGVDSVTIHDKANLPDEIRRMCGRSIGECLPGFPIAAWDRIEAE